MQITEYLNRQLKTHTLEQVLSMLYNHNINQKGDLNVNNLHVQHV